jgi:hypothetical protein
MPNDRPVWEQPALWARAASSGRVLKAENEILRLSPSDPRVNGNYNQHVLALGKQGELHEAAAWFFGAVRRMCGFGAEDFWDDQEDWLDAVFRRAFPEGGEGMGWVSLYGCRRPAHVRVQQDPAIRVTQNLGAIRVARLRQVRYLDQFPWLELGQLALPTRGLRFAAGPEADQRKGHIFALNMPRRVQSDRFHFSKRYEEVWLCQASDGEESRLRRGQIPAVPESQYRGPAICLRVVPMLNLMTVTFGSRITYTQLSLEINPNGGDILSVRWNRMPLAAGLLCSCLVEHVGLCQAFRSLGI